MELNLKCSIWTNYCLMIANLKGFEQNPEDLRVTGETQQRIEKVDLT